MIGVFSFSLLTGVFAKEADKVQVKEPTKAEAYIDGNWGRVKVMRLSEEYGK